VKPRLLDAFCCEGGAGMGYHQAGFEVVGIDVEPQPRYPFEFHQGDAIAYIREHGHEFDAIHASPPCHDKTALKALSGLDGTGWMLGATRKALIATGRPYVLENVPGADMAPLVLLCGSMFGLGAAGRILRRHRWFETSFWMLTPPDQCSGKSIGGVYGTGGGGQMTRGYKFHPAEAAEAMGIDWMSRAGRSQAIPPAFTQFLAAGLVDQIQESAA
jgi:DNA (cytosine-5)-methyltransferase 1